MTDFVDPSIIENRIPILTERQIQSWREQGFILVDNVFDTTAVDEAIQQLNTTFLEDENAKEKKDFGGIEFPCSLPAVNNLILNESLISISQLLLGVEDIRLTQADAWAKYYEPESQSQYDNRDQRMHIDGWNHFLVGPADWHHPPSTAMIIYLSESTQTGGETSLVAREGNDDSFYNQMLFLKTPGAGKIPWINDRTKAEEWFKEHDPEGYDIRQQLYAREKKARFHKGSVLVYRHDLWHRGTPLKENSMRLTINLSYRRADADWFQHWNHGWARSMYSVDQVLENIVAKSSVKQRSILGFPRPGSSYWTETTLNVVKNRYEHLGFDAKPYEDALNK